jgi:hypothetical protein
MRAASAQKSEYGFMQIALLVMVGLLVAMNLVGWAMVTAEVLIAPTGKPAGVWDDS